MPAIIDSVLILDDVVTRSKRLITCVWLYHHLILSRITVLILATERSNDINFIGKVLAEGEEVGKTI